MHHFSSIGENMIFSKIPDSKKGGKVQQEHWSVHKSTRASDGSATTRNQPKNMRKIDRKLNKAFVHVFA